MQISLRSDSSIQIPRRCQMRCVSVTYYTRVIWNPLLCRTHWPRRDIGAPCEMSDLAQRQKSKLSALPFDEQIGNSVELIWLTVADSVCVCVCSAGGVYCSLNIFSRKTQTIFDGKRVSQFATRACKAFNSSRFHFIHARMNTNEQSHNMRSQKKKGCASARFGFFFIKK